MIRVREWLPVYLCHFLLAVVFLNRLKKFWLHWLLPVKKKKKVKWIREDMPLKDHLFFIMNILSLHWTLSNIDQYLTGCLWPAWSYQLKGPSKLINFCPVSSDIRSERNHLEKTDQTFSMLECFISKIKMINKQGHPTRI